MFQAIRKSVIKAKHDLSEHLSALIEIDLGTERAPYRRELTRVEFDGLDFRFG